MAEIMLAKIAAILWIVFSLVFSLGLSVGTFLINRDARKDFKSAEALKWYYEQKMGQLPLLSPCSTPPGRCPHARKVSDLDGGHYWICKDDELEQTALEEVKEGNEQGRDGESG